MVVKSMVIRLAATALLVAGPVAAQVQQAEKVYRIGLVASVSSPLDAFRQGLKEAGYVEGKNVVIEMRFAQGRNERFPELIAEVLRLKVDVLVAASSSVALAAKKATQTVPVVFAGILDPIVLGLVQSLARPGGNVTGVTFGIGSEVSGKWVELLSEAVPNVSHVAVLYNSANPGNAPVLQAIQTAARTLKVRADMLDAGNDTNLNSAFATIGASGAQGIIVAPDPFFFADPAKVVQFAASKRLPAMYFSKRFVDTGGLMSYGGSLEDSFRRAATYVDKILKGAKPADLPIEQPTRFELVINMKTAKALGLTIPDSILLRADRVIE